MLVFPEAVVQTTINDFFNQDRFKEERYKTMKDSGVVEKIVEVFKNLDTHSTGVYVQVANTVSPFKAKLGLPPGEVNALQWELTKVLEACAKDKPVSRL